MRVGGGCTEQERHRQIRVEGTHRLARSEAKAVSGPFSLAWVQTWGLRPLKSAALPQTWTIATAEENLGGCMIHFALLHKSEAEASYGSVPSYRTQLGAQSPVMLDPAGWAAPSSFPT